MNLWTCSGFNTERGRPHRTPELSTRSSLNLWTCSGLNSERGRSGYDYSCIPEL